MEYAYSGHVESAIDGFYLRYGTIAKQFGASYMLVTPWDLSGILPRDKKRFFAAVESDPGLTRVFFSNGVELFRVR
jgi:hypothetical protein